MNEQIHEETPVRERGNAPSAVDLLSSVEFELLNH